ncbi:hypothetical protein CARUB_v10027734mg [Capsella rubella]|uniref:Neprosin PEP catalytic domain-containing protein n=1 Tax=Capsella rubella TaxID=81985 RepID=R0GK31_9BRAS|nr:uncharacterized protein LOC17875033 [Capsella rubella]EOA12655.1 hypothetical protein CARUB_v10027734mg [Capsella rubella]
MSTEIIMALIMNLLPLLFSVALVHSDQSILPLKSFKTSGNVTYDCIDIHKQPGLDHPLLKNHTIQMKPSASRLELKNQTSNNYVYKKKIGCPYGTVPVLRNSKEYIINTQYFHPLSRDRPGTHIAGVRSSNGPFRGIEAWSNGYALNIGKDQASYSQIYIGSGSNKEVNFIQAGFMINPSVFGDRRVWSYGFWQGKDGKGCYNTACPGFVQVSHEATLVQVFDPKPGVPVWLRCSIHQDKQTGNWWVTLLSKDSKPSLDIGYWPKELFNLLNNGANMVGVGGVVQASRSGSSPPLGTGKFPTVDLRESAIFTNIEALNSNYQRRKLDSFHIEKLLDSPNCYGLRLGQAQLFHRNQLGYFLNYGGPGGKSCGV